MAIVIPSKHIYEKDNDKVRDNKVDKVEVKGIRPYISAYKKNEVYSESDEISDNAYITKNKTNVHYRLLENLVVGRSTVQFTLCCVQLVYTKYVKTYKIRVPKNINNKVINTIYMGEDENEQPNISCTVTCTKYTETDVRAHQVFLIDPKITNTIVTLSGDIKYPNFVDKERIGTITMSVPKGDMEYTNTFSANYDPEKYTQDYTVKVDFTDDSTNLVTAEMQYDEKTSEYTCDLTVLVGYEIQTLSGTIIDEEDASTGEYADVMLLKGTGELYEPNSIKLSFKGDYVTIDLVDKTVTINGDGTHPISFEGNELIQTTNYVRENGKPKDYITTAFGKTMDLYGNGKETATILCDIYDVAENEIQKDFSSTKQAKQSQTFNFYTPRLMDRGEADYYFFEFYGSSVGAGFDSITIVGDDGAQIVNQKIDLTTGDFNCTGKVPKDASGASISVICEKEERYSVSLHLQCVADDNFDLFGWLNGNYINNTITINGVQLLVSDRDEASLNASANDLTAEQFRALRKGVDSLRYGKLCFNIGDIVIPMTYGANGVDKPMSKYKDGSPKKFQVQGVRVFYDGAVWQELTLQEFS